VESSCHDDRGGRGEGGGEHSTSAVEEALRRQMEMQKVLQSQLEVRCPFLAAWPCPGSQCERGVREAGTLCAACVVEGPLACERPSDLAHEAAATWVAFLCCSPDCTELVA